MCGSSLDFDSLSEHRLDAKLLRGKLNLVRDYRDPYSDSGNGNNNGFYKVFMEEPNQNGDLVPQ